MGYDSFGRYTANHKAWDHVGNIIPDIEHSEGERPSLEGKPAPWLPVQFYDKHYNNWMVVMPGKAVAFDPRGDLMPAQYGLSGATVVYTLSDVEAGTIDVQTGLPVTGAVTRTLHDIATTGFMGCQGEGFGDLTAAVRYPVGVAPYAYLQWAGGDGFNPADYSLHNYNMQHQVAVLCDYVLRLPVIPAAVAAEGVTKTVTGNLVPGTPGTHTRAQAQHYARYNALTGCNPVANTDTVVAIALDHLDMARHTPRTALLFASNQAADAATLAGVLLYEKDSIAAVRAAGDFYVDYPMSVIFVYSANGTTIPIGALGGTITLRYFHYSAAASVLSRFACVLAPAAPGDFLVVGTGSNYVKAGNVDFRTIMLQVLKLEEHPRDALDRVRTAYDPALNTDASGSMANGIAGSSIAGMGQLDRMPGSATGGMPDLVSYSGAANLVAVCNIVSR
jgi:hypothetical protein